METCRGLPAAEICRIEKFVESADYWACLVEEPAPCQFVVRIGTVHICSLASKRGAWLKKKIDGQKIAVRYVDSSPGMVSKTQLDKLIESGRIAAFMRSSGWVDIARDPIRKQSPQWRYKGLQRRAGRTSIRISG
jgi:hypothetical protein